MVCLSFWLLARPLLAKKDMSFGDSCNVIVDILELQEMVLTSGQGGSGEFFVAPAIATVQYTWLQPKYCTHALNVPLASAKLQKDKKERGMKITNYCNTRLEHGVAIEAALYAMTSGSFTFQPKVGL